MAKTNFINGDISQGVQGTRVTAEFLNLVNNHRHAGQDNDGDGVLDYAVAEGADNAYTLALNPPLAAYIPGMPIFLRANHTNTGPATLNINGLGAVSIRALGQNLAAGMILNGQLMAVMYDGTNFQMISILGNVLTQADINTDNTTGNVSAAHHGFMPKLDGNPFHVFKGDGSQGDVSINFPGMTYIVASDTGQAFLDMPSPAAVGQMVWVQAQVGLTTTEDPSYVSMALENDKWNSAGYCEWSFWSEVPDPNPDYLQTGMAKYVARSYFATLSGILRVNNITRGTALQIASTINISGGGTISGRLHRIKAFYLKK